MSLERKYSPIVLAVIDGVGVAPPGEGNMVTNAHTPTLDHYWPRYPHTVLAASGSKVGLQVGEPGTTAFGHQIMGAGRLIPNMKAQIDRSIEEETFMENPHLLAAFEHAQKNDTSMHLFFAVDEQETVFSLEHILQTIKLAVNLKFDPDNLFLHLVGMEGKSAPDLVQQITDMCIAKHMGKVATVVGSYFAMDTGYNWNLTEIAYDAYFRGDAHIILELNKKLNQHYKSGGDDANLEPIQILWREDDRPTIIAPGDSLLFCNYANAGFGQLIQAIESSHFEYFDRQDHPQNLHITALTPAGENLPTNTAFRPLGVPNYLGELLTKHKVRQARIAEADKFAATTYFFDQMQPHPSQGQLYIEIPAGDRDQPGLNNNLATEIAVQKISEGFGFILINYSAVDIQAHSGDLTKVKSAMTFVDKELGKLAEVVLAANGCLLITSDHGNAEEMLHPGADNEDAHIQHTDNQVPFIAIGKDLLAQELQTGTLADIAPTILGLMNIEIPVEMTGRNLLKLR